METKRFATQHKHNIADLVAAYGEERRQEVEAAYNEARRRHEKVSKVKDFIPIIAFREAKMALDDAKRCNT